MSRRSHSTYSSYSSSYQRESHRKIPSPLPYLAVALLAAAGLVYFHYFAYQSLTGKVINAYSGKPLVGIVVSVQPGVAPGVTPQVIPTGVITASTASDGTFTFSKLPANPVVSVQLDGYAAARQDASGKRDLQIKLMPSTLSGKVMGSDNKPVPDAVIFAGGIRTVAKPDGSYLLTQVPADHKLVVKAAGYLSTSLQFGQVVTQDVTLQPFTAKAIYMNADSVATPGKLQALLDLIDRTELNAVVIDVKADNSGNVLYDSKVPIVQQLGTANPIIPNLDALLASLRAKKIYTIARLSVFWDQAVTRAKPEWALKSKKAQGQLWMDGDGKRWANPYNPQVWDYNVQIAAEVASRGFNEVQFDNAYFPSNGDLEDIDFGPDAVGKKRVDAISSFFDRAYTALSPMGVYVTIDTYALTPYVQDDMGVGHQFEALAARCDYLSPAIYPSMFADNFADFQKPAEHPFDIVAQTMKAATARLTKTPARIRPWLQDFSGAVQYDATKVRAEIDGAEQNGASGWMLWNFGNTYTEAALKGP